MTELSYRPAFDHLDWIDRVDQVQAGGPNGFNVRFHAIERDLAEASTVVGQIAGALRSTHRPGPGGFDPPTQLTFTPNLHPVAPFNAFLIGPTGAAAGTSVFTTTGGGAGIGKSANGVANLSLPEGLRLTTVRFVGGVDGSGGSTTNKVTVAVQRSAIPPAGSPSLETLASLQATGVGPIDVVATVPSNLALIDIHKFRYVVKVELDALSNGNSTLTIDFIQLNLAPSS
jgi:hypothetical protein